ncbi:hypothetical protein J6590_007466 [Homalodisca vitripennis]|nr:hypothetical protein J6590_007466 [Homalodisca vitripennis]
MRVCGGWWGEVAPYGGGIIQGSCVNPTKRLVVSSIGSRDYCRIKPSEGVVCVRWVVGGGGALRRWYNSRIMCEPHKEACGLIYWITGLVPYQTLSGCCVCVRWAVGGGGALRRWYNSRIMCEPHKEACGLIYWITGLVPYQTLSLESCPVHCKRLATTRACTQYYNPSTVFSGGTNYRQQQEDRTLEDVMKVYRSRTIDETRIGRWW